MIRFEDVTRKYGERVAVDGLNLHVESGQLFALLGRNGAGKTTTLKMLVGLLRPDRGKIFLDGLDVAADPTKTNQRIGYIPDEPRLYDKLTGREFLRFVGELYGMPAASIAGAIDEQVDTFQLLPFVDQLTESYSHGMKQRTVFAAALLHQPTALVVDEPMVGLDPHTIRLVKDLLRQRAAAGVAVLVSTHTLSAAEEIADRIGVMNQGRLIFCGTIDELRSVSRSEAISLEQLYLDFVSQRECEAAQDAR